MVGSISHNIILQIRSHQDTNKESTATAAPALLSKEATMLDGRKVIEGMVAELIEITHHFTLAME
jgi:hypothetical protein